MRFILLFFTAIVCSSCYTIQYYKVNSTSIPPNEKGELFYENDTLKIVYQFNGSQGPLKISVFNKFKEPIEINWRKSVLVMNRKVVGTFQPSPSFNGSFTRGNRAQSGDIQAEINMESEKQYMPPGSSVTRNSLQLIHDRFPRHSFDTASFEKISNSSGSYSVKAKKLHFSDNNSPFNFRIHLSFVAGAKEFYIDQPFFISEVWQSRFSPAQLPVELQNRANMFYDL